MKKGYTVSTISKEFILERNVLEVDKNNFLLNNILLPNLYSERILCTYGRVEVYRVFETKNIKKSSKG